MSALRPSLLSDTVLAKVWIGVAFSGLALVAHSFWSPDVEPMRPRELAPDTSAIEPFNDVRSDESMDFIFRPLFWSSRRPASRTEAAVDEVVEQPAETVASTSLEGVTLLGVFSSNSKQGAIFSNETNEVTRLYVGESLQGWRLERAELRSAIFRNGDGALAKLELAVASSLPLPEAVATRGDTRRVGSSGAPDSPQIINNSAAGESKREPANIPMTFEAIADRKRLEAESADAGKTARSKEDKNE